MKTIENKGSEKICIKDLTIPTGMMFSKSEDKKKSHKAYIIKGEDYFWGNIGGIVSPQLSCCLFRRELAIRVKAFEETQLQYCPDMVLWLKLSLLSDGCFINNLYAVYRKTEQHLTNTFTFKERFEDEIKGISVIAEFAKENGSENVNLRDWAKRLKRILLIENIKRAFSARVNRNGGYSLWPLVQIIWAIDKVTFLHLSFLSRIIGFFVPIKLLASIKKYVKYFREFKNA